jgi:hypothetical protein
MGDLCQQLEQLVPGEASSEQASATAIVGQLQALLPQLAQHIQETQRRSS